MYIRSDLAKATHDDKLRAAARHHLRGRAYAARRAGNRGNPVPRLAFLRALRAPPGRGLLGGTVQYTMTARTGPSTGRALGGRSVDAGSWAVREHAPHSLRLREARFR